MVNLRKITLFLISTLMCGSVIIKHVNAMTKDEVIKFKTKIAQQRGMTLEQYQKMQKLEAKGQKRNEIKNIIVTLEKKKQMTDKYTAAKAAADAAREAAEYAAAKKAAEETLKKEIK
ncbi:hypothetical protein BJI68_26635 [Escherichia coli]|nr:hypothetical protein [Escherichia coli]EAB0669151.1 hypothetical protein [Escherichia coli]EEW7009382.1 hypothetical protein [Escherichia coli]EGD6211825.1 hypothetical protein [Escherichia coli]OIZ58740.1 hypothetical protein BJI68_26635 [Escherichia coli]